MNTEQPRQPSNPSEPQAVETINYRQISQEELTKVLETHRMWIETGGKEGKKADLRKTNLQKADLERANLQGALIGKANLQRASLSMANLKKADLYKTDLREADLQNADLMGATGLLVDQLAGANVSGAKLPPDIHKFAGLSQVEELSKSAKKLFTSLLVVCAYAWITIATTIDAQLLTNSTSSPLPFIGAKIPIVGFYWVGPLILLSLYFWFNLYLQRLWKELAKLPAFFPDGNPLDEKAYPWLLNSLLRVYFVNLRKKRQFLSLAEIGLSKLLSWWIVPSTLVFFWIRYLPRHDWLGTLFHVSLLVMAIVWGIWFQMLTKLTLKGQQLPFIHEEKPWANLKTVWNTTKRIGRVTTTGVMVLVLALAVSDALINATESGLHRHYIPIILQSLGIRGFADLTDQDLSHKPLNWFRDGEVPRLVKGIQLKGFDLRNASASEAFLVNANLTDAALQKAFLRGADLRHAKLTRAKLQNSVLRVALLTDADLSDAQLQGADLRMATLRRTTFEGANLENANLEGINVRVSSLRRAILRGTNLRRANLTTALNLTQEQIDEACVDQETKLPETLTRPEQCPELELSKPPRASVN